MARDAGWAALTFTFRGTGTSEGDFSIDGWRAEQVVDELGARIFAIVRPVLTPPKVFTLPTRALKPTSYPP